MAITISSRLSFSPFVLNFILVLVVLFLSEGARGVVIPILSNLVEIQLQQSALFLAFVVADFSIGRLLASLVLGYLSDFRGWPTIRLLQLCLISAAVGNVLFMCVPAAASSGAAAAVLIFARFITGFGTGVLTTARTFITETTPAEKRAKFLGYLGVVQFGAFVLSPLLAGFSFGVSSGLFDIDQYTTGTFILLTMEAMAIVMLWWLSTRASTPIPPLPVSAEALSNAAAVQPNAADSSNPVPYRAAPLSADRTVQLNVDVNQNLSSDADPLSSLRLPLSRHATVDGGAALPAVQVQSSTDAANSPLRPMRLPSLSRVTSSSSSSSSAGFSSPGKSNQGVAIEMEFIRRISAADMRAAVSRDDKSDSESENDSRMPNEKKVELDVRSPLTRGSRSLPHSELTTPLSPSTVRMQSRPLFSPSSRRTQDISSAAEESGGSARVEYLGPISTSSPSPSSSPVPSESPDSSAPRTMCGRMNAKLSAAWLFTRTHLSPPEIPLHVPMLFIFLNFAIRGSLGISESFATSLFYSVDSDAPSSEASYMFTIWGAIGLICFLTVQKLIEIVGELALLFLSLCSMTLGFFLLLSFDADAAESIGLFRYSMGMFFLWSLGAPIGQVLSASMLSKKMKGIKQGWLMGVFTAAGSLGRIILPLISGALDSSATGGLDGVHGFGCAVMGLTTCVVLFYRIRWPATFASS